jgi:hypothetical protein
MSGAVGVGGCVGGGVEGGVTEGGFFGSFARPVAKVPWPRICGREPVGGLRANPGPVLAVVNEVWVDARYGPGEDSHVPY